MLIDNLSILKLPCYLLLLRLLDLVHVLDRLLISEIMEVGFSNLVVNFGLVLTDGVSGKSWIAGLVSPTKDRSKHRPLDRLMRVTVLIVFLLECGGRDDGISSSASAPKILIPLS